MTRFFLKFDNKHRFLFFALLLYFQANAKQIEIGDATIAGRFFIAQTLDVNPNDIELNLTYTAVNIANPIKPLYYIFDICVKQKQGFIIISADDIVRPILGYSLHGFYNQDDMPPNFDAWMREVAELIRYGRKSYMDSDPRIFAEWKALLEHDVSFFIDRKGEKTVTPLITTKWDQGDPYNQQCPIYQGNRCMTGCVATTMAQLMKYYSFPTSGTGTTPAYTTPSFGISIPAITLGAAYQWSSMINQYGSSATQTQKDAVSLLMYHCGASVKMDYRPNASGAGTTDAAKSLTSYFRYDKSMLVQDRSYYSDNDWIALLKQELNTNRPLYYKASGPAGGHAFICDGYDNSSLFHFNWGWSGIGDGYYSINALKPPGYSFPNAHAVFIGLKPDAGGAPKYQIDMYYDKNLESSVTSVQPMVQFIVSVQFYNSGYRDATGLQGAIGLFQGNTLISIIGTRNLGDMATGYYFTAPQSFICQVPTGTPYGNYTIRAITKTSDSDWTVARASNGYKTELPLQVNSTNYISEETETLGIKIYPNPTNGVINVQCLMFNVQNIEIFDIMGRIVAVETHGRASLHETLNVKPEITFDLSNVPSGIYFVRIQTEKGMVMKRVVKQ